MRFGIFDHMELRDGEALDGLYEHRLQMLEAADAAGFWCYHKAEHHFTPLDVAPSSNVFLAAAAQRTERIRFGPLVYLLPFYDPIRLIEEICVLDQLSGGRLEIGVGKGISPAEHTLWGHSPDDARPHFEEAFEILRNGIGSPSISHRGEHYTFEDVPLLLTPKQSPHPPFWYPGNVEYAGRHRLNTVVGGPIPSLEKAAARYQTLVAEATEDWNPGVAEPCLAVTCHVYVAESDTQAVERARRAYPRYHENLATLFKRYGVPFPSGDPSLGGDVDLALSVNALVAGSPDTVAEYVRSVADAVRTDYLISSFAWGDLTHEETTASLALYASEVMPRFPRAD
jgi:alkanesulfonate monooxygenase SsuD/methylene tetrahydromethanopterin reductase-like flavin-dependent oxidoreductase (luciferase family)